jgi:hypothetical protein
VQLTKSVKKGQHVLAPAGTWAEFVDEAGNFFHIEKLGTDGTWHTRAVSRIKVRMVQAWGDFACTIHIFIVCATAIAAPNVITYS